MSECMSLFVNPILKYCNCMIMFLKYCNCMKIADVVGVVDFVVVNFFR